MSTQSQYTDSQGHGVDMELKSNVLISLFCLLMLWVLLVCIVQIVQVCWKARVHKARIGETLLYKHQSNESFQSREMYDDASDQESSDQEANQDLQSQSCCFWFAFERCLHCGAELINTWMLHLEDVFERYSWKASSGRQLFQTKNMFIKADVLKRTSLVIGAMFMLEQLVAGILFWSVFSGRIMPSWIFQILFLAVALFVEYLIYLKIEKPFGKDCVRSLMGMPIHWLRLPRWLFDLAMLAPNYIHVLATAPVAAASWSVLNWSPADAAKYSQDWSSAPLIGTAVGSLGIPGALTAALILGVCLHLGLIVFYLCSLWRRGRFPWSWKDSRQHYCGEGRHEFAELCDSANFQFLGRAIRYVPDERPIRNKHPFVRSLPGDDNLMEAQFGQPEFKFAVSKQNSRLMVAFLKLLMTDLKVTLFSIAYDTLQWDEWAAALLAILLAFYGLFQLFGNFFLACKQAWRIITMSIDAYGCCQGRVTWTIVRPLSYVLIVAMLCFLTCYQVAHFVGVFVCPYFTRDSRDLSFFTGCH